MQIIDNKALLLRVKNPERVTECIPKAKILPDGGLLVKWGLEEAQVLVNLGIKNVPSPITAHYEWCGMYEPFNHQRATAGFLTLHRRAFCLNEAGTGKTNAVIWAADYLMSLGLIKRVLVLCPMSIMNAAWASDLFRTAMHRTVAVAHHTNSSKRRVAVSGGAEFVICNFDGLEIVQKEVMQGGFDLVVVDECNYYKNTNTNRYKVFKRVITPKTWIWMLTGTPASQSPMDAYGLAKIINPTRIPPTMSAFRDSVMYKATQFRWIPKPTAEKTVYEALQPAIRYTKDECLDLPEMLYTKRDTPLSKQQFKYYEELRKQMVTIAAGEEISAANAAAAINKLLQISLGCVYVNDAEFIKFDISHRFNELLDIIAESSHKVLVFVPFRHVISVLEMELIASKVSCAVIHGGVNLNKRSDIFDRFQTEAEPKVLVIQPQAASHGLTLHAANTVVWWGPITSVETYIQANARVHRAGQKNACTVVHLQGSSIEKRLYKMLDEKIGQHEMLVDLYRKELGGRYE